MKVLWISLAVFAAASYALILQVLNGALDLPFPQVRARGKRELKFRKAGDGGKRAGPRYDWNPSVLYLDSFYAVAVRESPRCNCGGALGLFRILFSLTRPAISRVWVGTAAALDGSRIELRTGPDNALVAGRDGEYHFGHEDPRWVVDEGRIYLLSVKEIRSQPKTFLTRVKTLDPAGAVQFERSVQLSLYAQSPEKNWMHLPREDKPVDRKGQLAFVYSLDPLRLVWSDPDTGRTELFYAGAGADEGVDTYRISGSTQFLPFAGKRLPQERQVFWGIGHSKEAHPFSRGDWVFNRYRSHFVLLSQWESGAWTVRWSHGLAFPEKPRRIQIPTAITQAGDRYLISLGEMDCTAHVVEYNRQELDGYLATLFNRA